MAELTIRNGIIVKNIYFAPNISIYNFGGFLTMMKMEHIEIFMKINPINSMVYWNFF